MEKKVLPFLFQAERVVWTTSGGGVNPINPSFGTIHGLARTIQSERDGIQFVVLALELHTFDSENIARAATNIMKILQTNAISFESELVEREGVLYINRIIEAPSVNSHLQKLTASTRSQMSTIGDAPPLKLNIALLGDLSSLRFINDNCYEGKALGPNEVEIEVKVIGASYLDCLLALGRDGMDAFGLECAGIIGRVGENAKAFYPGDRVRACCSDSYKTFVRCNFSCVAKMPDATLDGLSYTEAASLPAAFVTAYQVLHKKARLRAGESVPIHSGAGGLGHALVQVARYPGAEIFTTVGTEEKRRVMINVSITEDHILYSRDRTFRRKLKALTDNRGVDVVVNSLASEFFIASLECLAPFGRMVDLNLQSNLGVRNISISLFAENITLSTFSLPAVIQHRPRLIQEALQEVFKLVSEGQLSVI